MLTTSHNQLTNVALLSLTAFELFKSRRPPWRYFLFLNRKFPRLDKHMKVTEAFVYAWFRHLQLQPNSVGLATSQQLQKEYPQTCICVTPNKEKLTDDIQQRLFLLSLSRKWRSNDLISLTCSRLSVTSERLASGKLPNSDFLRPGLKSARVAGCILFTTGRCRQTAPTGGARSVRAAVGARFWIRHINWWAVQCTGIIVARIHRQSRQLDLSVDCFHGKHPRTLHALQLRTHKPTVTHAHMESTHNTTRAHFSTLTWSENWHPSRGIRQECSCSRMTRKETQTSTVSVTARWPDPAPTWQSSSSSPRPSRACCGTRQTACSAMKTPCWYVSGNIENFRTKPTPQAAMMFSGCRWSRLYASVFWMAEITQTAGTIIVLLVCFVSFFYFFVGVCLKWSCPPPPSDVFYQGVEIIAIAIGCKGAISWQFRFAPLLLYPVVSLLHVAPSFLITGVWSVSIWTALCRPIKYGWYFIAPSATFRGSTWCVTAVGACQKVPATHNWGCEWRWKRWRWVFPPTGSAGGSRTPRTPLITLNCEEKLPPICNILSKAGNTLRVFGSVRPGNKQL